MVRRGGQSLSTLNIGCTTPENSIQVFEAILLQLLEWLGVEWSEYQIRETAELMSAEYYWMTLPELKAFTAKIKTGHYGKEWGKLRPLMLMGWIQEWSSDLLEARASVHGKVKEIGGEAVPGIHVGPERVSEALNAFVEKFSEPTDGMTDEAKEAIYRQEKIKQRQRDIELRKKQEE